eukprot:EG_transcript_39116
MPPPPPLPSLCPVPLAICLIILSPLSLYGFNAPFSTVPTLSPQMGLLGKGLPEGGTACLSPVHPPTGVQVAGPRLTRSLCLRRGVRVQYPRRQPAALTDDDKHPFAAE